MALFTEEAARAGIRVKDGRRVFYLATGDRLTPAAREWLRQQHVEVLPAAQAAVAEYRTPGGAVLSKKPEDMTHLTGNILVPKDHPRIRFRGAIDSLEAALLLAIRHARSEGETETEKHLEEALLLTRGLIPADVLGEPAKFSSLGGLTPEELRQHSHFPQKYYDQPHFMPAGTESFSLLSVNMARTAARHAELMACDAFRTRDGAAEREDILTALNRLSSFLWILMIRLKAKENSNGHTR